MLDLLKRIPQRKQTTQRRPSVPWTTGEERILRLPWVQGLRGLYACDCSSTKYGELAP